MAQSMTIDMEKLISERLSLEIEIKVTHYWRGLFRAWLGGRIIKLGAWIMGCKVKVIENA